VRKELEVEVADFAMMSAILESVGLMAHQIYEKYRETFRFGEVEVVLDELPFGDFVELEGKEAAIRAAAGRLGLAWEERVLVNYLGLLNLLQERYALPFDDLTFENFADQEVTVRDLLESPGDLAEDIF
jgi:adenylate cyclase class 2